MRVLVADRRKQLMEAAIRLLWRQGVEHTTLRDIAREAGAPLASVHYCFENKDGLMQAAVEHWLAEMVGNLVEDVGVEGGLRQTVLRLSEEFWKALEANPPNVLAQIEVVLWSIRGSEHRELAQGIYPRYGDVVGHVFQRALDAAGETASISPGTLARTICAVIDSASLQFLANPDSAIPKEIYDFMTTSILDGVNIRKA